MLIDAVFTALFRATLNEVRVEAPTHETGMKVLLAPRPLNGVPKSELGADNLSAVGRKALLPAPSMWN